VLTIYQSQWTAAFGNSLGWYKYQICFLCRIGQAMYKGNTEESCPTVLLWDWNREQVNQLTFVMLK